LRHYEGLFLFKGSQAARDWDGLVRHVHGILEKHRAKILKSEKWGERRLAYEVRNVKRGTYLLVYFQAPRDSIANIEYDCKLSERILRDLILADEKIPEKLEAEKKEAEEAIRAEAARREAEAQAAAEAKTEEAEREKEAEKVEEGAEPVGSGAGEKPAPVTEASREEAEPSGEGSAPVESSETAGAGTSTQDI
jgi:ribosomal protein S6